MFRRLVILALVVTFVYTVYTYRDQLVTIVDVLQNGVWYLMLAALLVLGLAIHNQTVLYANIYNLLAVPSNRREMLPLYLVRRFVQVAAPSGGFSGWVPFIQFARRRDIPVGAVFAANLVYTILWYSTFGVFLLLGLSYLFLSQHLQWFEISAALVMLAADLVMIVLLVLAWVAPQVPGKIMHWAALAVERVFSIVKRPAPVSDAQLATFASDLNEGVEEMRKAGWGRLLVPVIYALLNETMHLAMLYVIALAFNLHLNFGVLVAAYSVSVLFWVVSPTPGGLGFVEGTLIIVLTALDVPAGVATVVTLAYRGITFWLPFIMGFVALRWVNKHSEKEKAGPFE